MRKLIAVTVLSFSMLATIRFAEAECCHMQNPPGNPSECCKKSPRPDCCKHWGGKS